MPYIHAQVSSADLLQAVEQMPPAEMEAFLQKVATINARRKAKSISQIETELLQRINRPVPEPLLSRYQELIAHRRAEQLSTEEHTELVQLAETLEIMNAERIRWLADLAQLQGITLRKLMDDLGIKPQPYA